MSRPILIFGRGEIYVLNAMAEKREKTCTQWLGEESGNARIQRMAPEQRGEIARKAVLARWPRDKKDQKRPE
jgi:hypothetical protein